MVWDRLRDALGGGGRRGAARTGGTPRYADRYQAGEPKRRRYGGPRPVAAGPVGRMVNHWWDRLLSAASDGSLSGQSEQYLPHRTSRDYLCNSLGQAAWGFLFPLLTIITTQVVGTEQAGVFSLAFVVGTLLLFLGNYGVRTFQVSDLDEMESFLDYQVSRVITVTAMLATGYAYCRLHGYGPEMTGVCMAVLAFRAIDALADVYEGRLQQKDKLYLAGISQMTRCVVALLAYTLVLVATRSLVWASVAMAAGAAATLLLLSLPLALLETERSLPLRLGGIREILVECLPLFLGLFLYNLIDSVPKFAMEGALTYDNQLYFNAMYFPAHAIIMLVGFAYKPQLVRLAGIWDDESSRHRFDLVVLAMLGVVALVTVLVGAFMCWLGIPLLGILYGVDFERFRPLVYLMVATGGICAAIDFLYQAITVLRKQGAVLRAYAITVVLSVPVSLLLVRFSGLSGAVMASLVSMSVLAVLLVSSYVDIRRRLG